MDQLTSACRAEMELRVALSRTLVVCVLLEHQAVTAKLGHALLVGAMK